MIRSTLKRIGKQLLARVGAPSAVPSPAAPPPAPAEPAAPPADVGALTRMEAGAQEVKERLDAGEPVLLLDVRSAEELRQGMIAGALHIPLPELEGRWRELEQADEVVCYCASGGRSLRAAALLREKGLFNATSMDGGVGAWLDCGGALVPPGAARP